jgi:hypothetical protein
MGQSNSVKDFIGRFPHLAWPLFDSSLFAPAPGGVDANFLDVSHSLNRIADQIGSPGFPTNDEDVSHPEQNPYGLIHWSSDDPLGDLLLTTFGAYPAPEEIGRDYERFIRENIRPAHYWASQSSEFPAYLLDQTMPTDICGLDLTWDRIPSTESIGFYAGMASAFEDLVNYWNLRAADLNVVFLDPQHTKRLGNLREEHLRFIRQRQNSTEYRETGIHIWSRSQEIVQGLGFDPALVPHFFAIDGTAIIGGNLRPPLHYFKNRTVVASLSEEIGEPVLALQLPDKPFESDDAFSQQHFVVSVKPPFENHDDERTLWTPYLPGLNQWYGRQLRSESLTARVEVEGIGIICPISDESLELSPMNKQALANRLFEFAGIEANQSIPGRIASRLIEQLGGLRGCRVFKIAGVRNLIKEYGPLQEFDRTAATRIIGNRDLEGRLHFSEYESIFLEPREPKKTKLTPEDAFLYLLDKGVFRAGLTLTCSVCELEFWVGLDDLSTQMDCDVCGRRFNISRQLKDRGWTYRRSGLFGRDNNQEGSIPVALTLQQLVANLDSLYDGSLFLTNISLKPVTAKIEPCETDLFVAMQGQDRVQVAVGECKDAGGAITAEDARKMAAVADSFPHEQFESYVIFSKTAPFTPEDIENCRQAQPKNQRFRVIMLSNRELEPNRLYERTSQDYEIRSLTRSLSNMAEVTHAVYFAPRVKSR